MNEHLSRRLLRAVAEGMLLAALSVGGCGPLVGALDGPDAGPVADAGGTGGFGAGVGGGRPLLVDGVAVTAAVVHRSDWV